jgi:META domain
MKSINPFLILCCMFAITAFSCKKDDEANKQVNPLLIKAWKLTSIQNTKTNQMIEYPDSFTYEQLLIVRDSISLLFEGCGGNHGNAIYSVNNNAIKLSDIVITHMDACLGDQWNDYFFNNLERAFRFNVTANKLIIYSKGDYNLYFVPNSK